MKLSNRSSMGNKIILVLMITALILITACGKKDTGDKLNYEIKTVSGVKVFANDKTPSVDKIEMNVVEQFTINGDVEDELQSFAIQQPTFDIDKEGNIYVVDIKSSSLKKFDKDGNFVAQLGRKGTGPGEFFMPMSVITANDTIYGFDARMKINKYDMSNNFVSAISISPTDGNPMMLKRAGDNFVGYRVSTEQKNSKIFIILSLTVIDGKFNTIRTIAQNKIEFDPAKPFNPLDLITFFAVGENKVFVAEKSADIFKIKVYDFEGNNIYNITKNFRKVKYSKKEIELANKAFADAARNTPGTPEMKFESRFKEAITGMWYDKNDRLWVGTAIEDDGSEGFSKKMILDVFKDGVFLNSYTFQQEVEAAPIDFINDKLIIINTQDSKIKVYDY